MPILHDIPIALTAEEIIASPDKNRIQPALLRDAEQAITLGQTLWQPQAVYGWFDVQAVEGEDVVLASADGRESTLRIGPKADLMAPAKRALAGVITIGQALEDKVHELQAGGDSMMSYLLDSAGVVALGAAGEALRCLVEEEAADLGWGVSPSLSPGSLVGWSLLGQRELCALLPLEEIGVRLNAHYILEPHKSVSALVAMGPGYDEPRVGSVCKYCALQKTCWRRREDPS
jgi:cobalamin-dependent methionine synthase I